MSPSTHAGRLAETWIELWNRGTPDAIPLADGFVHTSPFGTVEGRDDYLDWVRPLAAGNAGKLCVKRTLASGNEAVIHYEMQTPKGTIPACDWLTVDGDEIMAIHSFYDATLLRE